MNRPGETPLASLLLRRIFATYVVLALTLTVLQVYLEYRNTYHTVRAEMAATAYAFEPGITNAVWNFQKSLLDSITQGMVSGGSITAVAIEDVYQHVKLARARAGGEFNAFKITQHIPLFYTYSDGKKLEIGRLTVYSNHQIIIERVKLGILLILIASLIKTLGLWYIIRFFIQRLLAGPLTQFTEQIKHFDLTHTTQLPQFDSQVALSQELRYLQEAFKDLAARALASRQVLLQKEVAETASLSKSRFLAAASHDLRQPIHALNLYLAMLDDCEIPPPIKVYIENMGKCVAAMSTLLNGLLDIASIDAGMTPVQLSVFPIAAIFERMRNEFIVLAGDKGLQLRFARCSAFVCSDVEIVERILRNLVTNAIRYTESGKILVGCRQRGRTLRIAVYDTGCGIPAAQQQAIFTEYYQINNPVRQRTKGLGLGLAIVERLAKLLTTEIILHSQIDKGSMFAFDLPRSQPTHICSPLQTDLTSATTISAAHALILVIDDEPLILDATCTLLESWGYSVIAASSGRAALRELWLWPHPPNLIICDYLLADGENGIDVISASRASFNQAIPALLITGDTLPEHIQMLCASRLPFLHKPLNQQELRAAILALLEHPLAPAARV